MHRLYSLRYSRQFGSELAARRIKLPPRLRWTVSAPLSSASPSTAGDHEVVFDSIPANKAAAGRAWQAAAADGATGIRGAILWGAGYYTDSSVQMRAAKMIYESCAERAEAPALLETCKLSDDFSSRFNLLVLHIWMLLVRMRSVPSGEKVSQLVYDMWLEDMEDKLGEQNFNFLEISKFSKDFQRTLYGSAFAYDQSLQGSDATLASALCRNVFSADDCEADAVTVARTVGYVRQHLSLLEAMEDDELTREGKVPWV